MNILKHIINWSVWSLLALYLIVIVALRTTTVQQFLGNQIADAIGQKLGTKVSVGRVDLGLFNRIIIDDVTIWDQQQKKMLQVARIATKVELLPLVDGRISISSAQVFGAKASFYKTDAASPANFKFVLDSLASKDTTGSTPFNLHIGSLIMRRSAITYEQYDVAPTHGKINPAHLNIQNISAHILLKTLKDDSVNVVVKRLAANEQSGLQIDRLSFHMIAGLHQARCTDFVLEMPDTHLQIDSIAARYELRNKQLSEGSLSFSGSISDSRITPSDLRSLLPALKNYQSPISISTSFSGTDHSFRIPTLTVTSPHDDIAIAGRGEIRDWKNRFPLWHVSLDNLSLSDKTVDFLTKTISGIPDMIRRLGNLHLSGTFDGDANGTIVAQNNIGSGIGDVKLDLTLHPGRQFSGDIETEGLDLRQLLDNEQVGTLATNIQIEGQIPSFQQLMLKAEGTVSQLEYNNYNYENISLNATYSAQSIAGHIDIDDPSVTANIEGEIQPHHYNIRGSICNLSPKSLNLTDRWGDARFSADILADFEASSLNDIQGNLDIRHFTMDDYRLDHLHITSGFIDQQHFISMNSDFAQAELTGEFDVTTLPQSIINAVGFHLPTLPGLPPVTHKTDNNFSFNLRLTQGDFFQNILQMPLTLKQPISLKAVVNAPSQRLDINAMAPAFSYNGTEYQTGHLAVSTPADTMKCQIGLTKLSDEGFPLDIGLSADAADNQLTTSLRWNNNDPEKPMNGVLNAVARLYRNAAGQPEANINVLPSQTYIGASLWTIAPANIIYSDNHLTVDNFTIGHDDQYLQVNGTASRSPHDSLLIDLNKIEVDYILNLVNFHAVEFGGQATGRAYMTQAFGETPTAHASLRVDHFLFEYGRMGTLQALVDWNQQQHQIDIHATANDGPEATTYINGYVAPSSSTQHPLPYIDLSISAHGTYIDFMHSFTESFLSNVTGHAQGDLRLAGPLSAINLTGGLVVDGQATVTTLNTTYELRKDTVTFIYNEIMLDSVPIYDKHNNIAYMSGGIHHQDLTRLTFDLNIDTPRLLAYDHHDFGDQSFYGTVMADGHVAIEGRPGRVTIDCDVTPLDGTTFVYNASQTDAIANQEFITFIEPSLYPDSPARPAEPDSSPTDIYLNFHINATPQAALRLLMDANTDDYITLYGTGDLRATYHNKGAFQMFGTYTVNRGTYDVTIQNIIKKNFQFQDGGTIVFGGDPYDAALALQAVYTVNGVSLSDLQIGNSFSSNTVRVNCLMNIGGQPKSPQVTFDLDLPNVNADEKQMVRSLLSSQQEMNQQVLYLLGIGRFYNQGQNNASQQQDQTSLAMQSFLSGTLSTQINTVLNSVIKNDQWNFGANISTGTEGWNNAEYEGIVNGRLLNNRLLINGQFGYRDNATQANPSFIGDFDIRYLLLPNGNIALKVYNQTNDRYFTRSSLNTQGIGVILKHDFNGLSELFQHMRLDKNKTGKK